MTANVWDNDGNMVFAVPAESPIPLDPNVSNYTLLWNPTSQRLEYELVESTTFLQLEYADKVDYNKGASLVGHIPNLPGAVGMTLYEYFMSRAVSFLQFMTPAQRADVQGYTALMDVTTPVLAALATGLPIIMSPGAYWVNEKVFSQNGQLVQGLGRLKAYFVIKPSFNLAQDSVYDLGLGEPGAQLFDVGFKFEQPDQNVRANLIQYPYAINCFSNPRAILDRIRIEGAHKGINAKGNSGGAYFGFLEIGSFNTGLEIDGSLDFFHGGHWHFWPFGVTGKPLLSEIYNDGVTKAAVIGRVDGLSVDVFDTFHAKVEFTVNADPVVPNHISQMKLDGDGSTLSMAAGLINIAQLYSTKSSLVTVDTITATAGDLKITQINTNCNSPVDTISTTGIAKVSVSSGRMAVRNPAGRAALCQAGEINIEDVEVVNQAGTVYTNAMFQQDGTGALTVKNTRWAPKGTSSGIGISFVTDTAGNCAQGNDLKDWGYIAPALPALGVYGHNHTPLKDFVPEVGFTTMGDFVPTYQNRICKLRHTPDGIWFDMFIKFDSNAHTTAAGAFIVSNMPAINNSGGSPSFELKRWSKFLLTGGYTDPGTILTAGTNVITFIQSGSGLNSASMLPANVPPSTAGFELSITGLIPNA